jgi:hypothetical protein
MAKFAKFVSIFYFEDNHSNTHNLLLHAVLREQHHFDTAPNLAPAPEKQKDAALAPAPTPFPRLS